MWAAHARAPPGTHESRTRGQWDGAGAGVLGIRIFKPPPPRVLMLTQCWGPPRGVVPAAGALLLETSPGAAVGSCPQGHTQGP